MINEDPLPPELEASTVADARAALVRAESLAALAAADCRHPTLLSPMIEKELRAIHVDDGGFRVFAVDERGNVKPGQWGQATARDVVARVITELPEMFFSPQRKR